MGGDSDYTPREDATHFPAIIMLDDSEDITGSITGLQELGVTVLRNRGNLLLTFIPVDADLSSFSRRARGVKKIQVAPPRRHTPLMNQARQFNNANLIEEGANLPQPFDGKGVVVGVCDIGFDARHPNFLNSDGTECRIRRVVHYREQLGERTVLSTPQEIYDWETDDTEDWHATHVTGIAAGAHKESGYYSLAPEADIVFTASQLSDVGLLAGVEDIIEYAKSVEKPAVINLSMGNYVGPHDGTSLFSIYLDRCADDAIICLSAGNEGQGGMPKSMSFDFTEERRMLEVRPNDYGATDYAGEAEVWSSDDRPFLFTFYWKSDSSYAKNRRPYSAIIFSEDSPTEWRISADPSDPDYDEEFAFHSYEGYVKATGGVSPLNNRYYVRLEFQAKSDVLHPGAAWGEWWPAMKLEGEPGVHIDVFAGGGVFLHAERNNPAPDNRLCFSDLATGKRTISVGMMNNTDVEEGALPGSGLLKGEVCVHSSYGTLPDGRVMPLTCAPGAYVISSMSSAFIREHPDYVVYTDDSSDFNGETVYWIGTLGTSMSCPFVAGAIATWLQAYPALTPEDVQSIIETTNITSGYPYEEDPRHGRGWFNAYGGMLKVLELAALKVGTVDCPDVTAKVINGVLHIANPAMETLAIDVYSASGIKVTSQRSESAIDSFPLTHLSHGVYLIRVSTRDGKVQTLKALLR